jgi:uncharacterized cupredoxin-like copper-binding protein
MTTRTLSVLPAAAVALALTTSGAGADVNAAAKTLRVKADPGGDLTFSKKRLSAPAGRVTIVMRNPKGSGLQHAVAIDGKGVDKSGGTAGPGGTSRVTAKLGAGRYTFYCPVEGHRLGGMKGRLTVR